jgi:chromosome segregation ATPase
MKNRLHSFVHTGLAVLAFFVSMNLFAQAKVDKEALAISKAEEKLEAQRLKLVEIKIQIESADSLMQAGENLEADAKTRKAEARDEIKAIEKQYKDDTKGLNKAAGSKDKVAAASAKTELKDITAKYKATLKEAENKMAAADKDISASFRMLEKADKKLDMLSDKLKTTEQAYKDAEKALNDKKEGKK